ncbi:hypothetical protein OEZ85_012058 [Tetradesmus obliquus]|uniref:Fe2OG dioxygenase domain-containing protein n=1 Tax=Tetradesmus obliquus TaxID=3088 RepID=A0ABY8TUL5_TETOB|nr:hypothetical protein OEZ85_012058 [Tetradesmus obliquus]
MKTSSIAVPVQQRAADDADSIWFAGDAASQPMLPVRDFAACACGQNQFVVSGGFGSDLGTWPTHRRSHAAALIGHQLFVHGGLNADGAHLADMWCLDLQSWQWRQCCAAQGSEAAVGPSARRAHTLEVVGNRYLLLHGGYDGTTLLGDTWVFDTRSSTWLAVDVQAPASEMPVPRALHCLTSIGERFVLLGGKGPLGELGDVSLLECPAVQHGRRLQQQQQASQAQLLRCQQRCAQLDADLACNRAELREAKQQLQASLQQNSQLAAEAAASSKARTALESQLQEARGAAATAQQASQQAAAHVEALERRLARARQGGNKAMQAAASLTQQLQAAHAKGNALRQQLQQAQQQLQQQHLLLCERAAELAVVRSELTECRARANSAAAASSSAQSDFRVALARSNKLYSQELCHTQGLLQAARKSQKQLAQQPPAAVGFSSKAAAQKRKRQQQRQRKRQGKADDDEDDAELTELSKAQHVITVPDFSPVSQQLRDVFDERFQDPRHTTQERFLWDYWYVKDQYTLHRTQASAYFPEQLHSQLVDALLEYGEKQLGCRAISPVWMSYYIDGCGQDLHCDSFHGPFAYVLSLTPWEGRIFTGGETQILQPQLLGSFWQSFSPGKGMELTDLVTLVEPRFNQLTVFDPRFPHGVRPVAGTRDPQKGRLVLHGWFTEPSPFFDGPLPEEEALQDLNAALFPMFDQLQALPQVTGTISMQLRVSGETGAVTDVTFLADTLVALPAAAADLGLGSGLLDSGTIRGAVQHVIRDSLMAAEFPESEEGDTVITLPLVFE